MDRCWPESSARDRERHQAGNLSRANIRMLEK
jgi:hypothetical protein